MDYFNSSLTLQQRKYYDVYQSAIRCGDIELLKQIETQITNLERLKDNFDFISLQKEYVYDLDKKEEYFRIKYHHLTEGRYTSCSGYCNLNDTKKEIYNPLLLAILYENIDLVKHLVENRGYNRFQTIFIDNSEHMIYIEFACFIGNREMIKYFIGNNPKIPQECLLSIVSSAIWKDLYKMNDVLFQILASKNSIEFNNNYTDHDHIKQNHDSLQPLIKETTETIQFILQFNLFTHESLSKLEKKCYFYQSSYTYYEHAERFMKEYIETINSKIRNVFKQEKIKHLKSVMKELDLPTEITSGIIDYL